VQVEVRLTGRGQRYEHLDVSGIAPPHDETASVGVLPDGESWAGRAPRIEHFAVGARRAADPLEKIEHEGLDGVGHQDLLRKTSNRSLGE
jgi:hypothetical protein